MGNALKALLIVGDLLTVANQIQTQLTALFQQAHAEGRDVTDAELDALTLQRNEAMSRFNAAVGS